MNALRLAFVIPMFIYHSWIIFVLETSVKTEEKEILEEVQETAGMILLFLSSWLFIASQSSLRPTQPG